MRTKEMLGKKEEWEIVTPTSSKTPVATDVLEIFCVSKILKLIDIVEVIPKCTRMEVKTTLGVFAEIIAKSPPSILIVLGVLLYLLQNGLGIWLIVAGILLNIAWLVL